MKYIKNLNLWSVPYLIPDCFVSYLCVLCASVVNAVNHIKPIKKCFKEFESVFQSCYFLF